MSMNPGMIPDFRPGPTVSWRVSREYIEALIPEVEKVLLNHDYYLHTSAEKGEDAERMSAVREDIKSVMESYTRAGNRLILRIPEERLYALFPYSWISEEDLYEMCRAYTYVLPSEGRVLTNRTLP